MLSLSKDAIPSLSTQAQYHGQTDIIFDVAWSPDGRLLASASADESVDVWRV